MKILEILDLYKLAADPSKIKGHDIAHEQDPTLSWDTYKNSPKDLLDREQLWKTDPQTKNTFSQYKQLIQQAANDLDPETAIFYAKYVMNGPWAPAEKIVKQDPEWAYTYARVIKNGYWPEGESTIKKDPDLAQAYEEDKRNYFDESDAY